MDRIYNDLVTRIKAKVPEILYIDYDAGQIDAPENNLPFVMPATFIDFETADWQTVGGQQVQVADLVVSFRTVFRLWNHTNSTAPTEVRTAALDALKLINKLHKYLQHYTAGNHYNGLDRFVSITERRTDGTKVFIMKYKTNIRDNWAMPDTTAVENLKLKITADIK